MAVEKPSHCSGRSSRATRLIGRLHWINDKEGVAFSQGPEGLTARVDGQEGRDGQEGGTGDGTINRSILRLPHSPDTGRVEDFLVADQPQVFGLRLRDQHSIEGIAVSDLELSCALCMLK
jgi:hypothetical protein